ncbi:hypothetical protein [Demequina sp.]|uniref:hypothetical protein n=1 Tax=Demequina sp. TaxID=2050685 RepID=UPI003D10CD7C
MTLRTAGLIAGVLGVILLAVGLIANAVKPASEGSPSAAFDTTVVVVTPDLLALSPDGVLTIEASGAYATHTARVQDADAWTASRGAVTLTGVADWDTLTFDTADPVVVSPTTSASPSPSASPSTSPSSSPTASPSTSASPSPTASPSPSVGPTPLGSQDIWRNTAQSENEYTIATVDVPAGLALVVEALGDAKLTDASLTLPRTVDDDWIMQVIWWGVGLTIIGLIALIALFVDVRPAQKKGEEWIAQRSAIGSGKQAPKPGSRRERRERGAAMPVALLPAEPTTTGSIPILVEEQPSTGDVPMIAIAERGQPAPPPAAAEPALEAFQPPATETEEDRS